MSLPTPPGPTPIEYEPSGLPSFRAVALGATWILSLGVAFWLGYRACFFTMRDDVLEPLSRIEGRLGHGMRQIDGMIGAGKALESIGASPKRKGRVR